MSHVEMWPYAASAAALSESQRATAVLMLSLSSALPATAGTKLATHRSAAGPIVVLALGSVSNRLRVGVGGTPSESSARSARPEPACRAPSRNLHGRQVAVFRDCRRKHFPLVRRLAGRKPRKERGRLP